MLCFATLGWSGPGTRGRICRLETCGVWEPERLVCTLRRGHVAPPHCPLRSVPEEADGAGQQLLGEELWASEAPSRKMQHRTRWAMARPLTGCAAGASCPQPRGAPHGSRHRQHFHRPQAGPILHTWGPKELSGSLSEQEDRLGHEKLFQQGPGLLPWPLAPGPWLLACECIEKPWPGCP